MHTGLFVASFYMTFNKFLGTFYIVIGILVLVFVTLGSLLPSPTPFEDTLFFVAQVALAALILITSGIISLRMREGTLAQRILTWWVPLGVAGVGAAVFLNAL